MSMYNDNIDNIKQQVNDFYSIMQQRSEEARLAAENAIKKAEEDRISAEKLLREKAEKEMKAYLELKKKEDAVKKAEEDQLAAKKKAEEDQLAAKKKEEEEKLAAMEDDRIAKETAAKIKEYNQRLVAEKKAEAERSIAEAQAESRRFAAESMAAAEKLAVNFAVYKAKEEQKAAEESIQQAEQEKVDAEKENMAAEDAARIAIESLKLLDEKQNNINKIISVAVSTIHNKSNNNPEKHDTNKISQVADTIQTPDEVVNEDAIDDKIIPNLDKSKNISDEVVQGEGIDDKTNPTLDKSKNTSEEIAEEKDSLYAKDKTIQEPPIEPVSLTNDSDIQNKDSKVNMLKMVISELLLELYIRNFTSKESSIEYQSPEIELQLESILDKNHAECMEILEKIKSKYPNDDVNYIMNDGKTCFIEVNEISTNVEIVGGSRDYKYKFIEEIDMDVDLDTINTDSKLKQQYINKDTLLSDDQIGDIKNKQNKSELDEIETLAMETINNNNVNKYSQEVSSITPQKLASIASIVVNNYLLSEKNDKLAFNKINNDNIEKKSVLFKDNKIKQIAASVVSSQY